MNEPSVQESVWQRLRRQPLALVSGAFLVGVALLVLLSPWISSYAPTGLSEEQFAPPSWQHWCGTDVHGRDLLSRLCYGTRISLLIGIVGAGVSLLIGVLWGATAALAGGRWDSFMMRFVDILYSLPSVVFVIVIITAMEGVIKPQLARMSPALSTNIRLLFLFVGLGAVSWLNMARIVRGQVLSLKNRQFIEASRALGASQARILFHHILPNIQGVVIAYLMLTIPSVIISESFLSYLGLGIQPPQASLGSLIAEGAAQINPVRIYWWMVFWPSAALVSTLAAMNAMGEALRR